MQTFPDFWYFSGTSRHPIRQVGNAVPPVLAAVWAKHVALNLFGIPSATVRTTDEMLVSLGQAHLLQMFQQTTIDAEKEVELESLPTPELMPV